MYKQALGPTAGNVLKMTQAVGKATTNKTQGGGTQTGLIGASARVPGGGSGVTRAGVKPLTKTAWQEAQELNAVGLISDEELRKIASVRSAVTAAFDECMTKLASDGFLDKMLGRLTGGLDRFGQLMTRAKAGMSGQELADAPIRVGSEAFQKSEVDALAEALFMQHKTPYTKDIPGGASAYEQTRSWVKGRADDDWNLLRKTIHAGEKSTQRPAMMKILGKGALGAGMMFGGVAAGSLVDDMFKERKRKRAFEEMFDAVPELRREDKRKVTQAYTVLSQFAPTVALNPVAAGYIVKQIVNMGSMADVQTVQALVNTEAGIQRGVSPTRQTLIERSIAQGLGGLMPV